MKSISFLFFSIILLISCKEEGFAPEPKSRLDSIYTIASDFYFWNDRLPLKEDFNFEIFTTPEAILNSFRSYSPDSVDKWSFAINRESWQKVLGGISGDFGLGLRFLKSDDLRIAYTQPNSSAGLTGLQRGLKVVRMNGIAANNTNLEQLNKEFQTSAELDLEIKNGDTITSFLLSRSDYSITSVLLHDTFNISGKIIAYLNLFTFSKDDDGAFNRAFGLFSSVQAEYLIVDLRYNGGGLLPVMEDLANLMACSNAYNSIMYQSTYNKEYEPFNSKIYFHQVTNAMCFKKIYFITAYKTASASEVLISSLMPYADIKIVGTNTYGKLMGMHTIPYADYTLVPVAFKILNKDGFHDDFKGFIPDISVIDGVDSNWNENEACIQAAIDDIVGSSNSGRKLPISDEDTWSAQGLLIEDIDSWNGAYLGN